MSEANSIPPSLDGQKSLARLAARRLHAIAATPLSDQLKDRAALVILDCLGAVVSGLQAPWAPSVIQYARSRLGATEAFAWGLNENVSAETAAFVNATIGHSSLRDDMHLKSGSHIGIISISAALALAQRDRWSGDQLLRGVIAGYEMAALLGTSIRQASHCNPHMRPSSVIGAFGAASAAIVASEVDEETAINALGFAANMANGFNHWAWAGGLEGYVEMGTAAQAGIIAFDIAQAGLKCSETLLEGQAGCFQALGAGAEGEAIFRKWLSTSEIGKGIMDVHFKPVPGCNFAQTPVAVALKIFEKYRPSGIEKIVVRTTSAAKNYPGCDFPGPFETLTQSKMSVQYGVCAALLYGHVSMDVFSNFAEPAIQELTCKCTLRDDSAYDQSFREGRQPAGVELTLSNGAEIREEFDDVPWLNAEAAIARFREETKALVPADVIENLELTVRGLESVQDCSQIFRLLKTQA